MIPTSRSLTDRGQITIEFVFVIATVIAISITYLWVANQSLADSSERVRLAALNDIGYTLQDEIILATTVEDGYERAILVPEKAGAFTYDLTPVENAVILKSGPQTITYDLPNATGTFSKGTVVIRKTDGEVIIA